MAENATQEKAAGQKKPRTLSKLERLQKELDAEARLLSRDR